MARSLARRFPAAQCGPPLPDLRSADTCEVVAAGATRPDRKPVTQPVSSRCPRSCDGSKNPGLSRAADQIPTVPQPAQDQHSTVVGERSTRLQHRQNDTTRYTERYLKLSSWSAFRAEYNILR